MFGDFTFTQGLIIFLILLVGGKDLAMAVLRKWGWINGVNHTNDEELAGKIADVLATNHFHEMIDDVRDLKRWQEEENKILAVAIELLRDIKNNTSKK